MNVTAIAVFGYNRPNHIQKCLESLVLNPEFKDYPVYIFLDGRKPNESVINLELVLKICEKYSQDFENIRIIKSELNFGLRKSIIKNLDFLFQDFESVIVLEDDLIASRDFLKYMVQSLTLFKNDLSIGTVAGFREGYFPFFLKSDLVAAKRQCCWGWATWKDRWDKVEWDIPGNSSVDFESDLLRLSQIGADLPRMYLLQSRSLLDSWSITFDANAARFGWRCIQPRINFISNAGFDGTGTHYNMPLLHVEEIYDPQGAVTDQMIGYQISRIYDYLLKISRSDFVMFLKRIRVGLISFWLKATNK